MLELVKIDLIFCDDDVSTPIIITGITLHTATYKVNKFNCILYYVLFIIIAITLFLGSLIPQQTV